MRPSHGTAVRLDQGHLAGTAASPSGSTNPGLPGARRTGMADDDEAAAPAGRAPGRDAVRRLDRSAPSPSSSPTSRSTSRPRRLRPRHRRANAAPTSSSASTWASRPARHRLRRRALGQDPDARRGDRRGAAPAARPPTSPATEAVDGSSHGGGETLAARPPSADQVHPRRRPRPVRPAARRCRWPARSARCRRDEPVAHVLGRRPSARRTPGRADAADARPRDDADQGEDVTIGSVFHVMPEDAATTPAGRRTSSRRRPRRPSSSSASTRGDIKGQKQQDWGYHGHRRLLQDLHPRRLPRRPVRAADPPPALPVPPVDLRRDAGLQGHLRPGQAAAAAAEDHRRRRGLPRRRRTVPAKRSARASGSVADEHRHRPRVRADALRERDDRHRAAPSAAARRSAASPAGSTTAPARAKPVGYLLKKVFPDHWSFMLGEIAMYSLIICLLTGAFLTFWFVPSAGHVVYDGSYVPLRGITHVRGLRVDRSTSRSTSAAACSSARSTTGPR